MARRGRFTNWLGPRRATVLAVVVLVLGSSSIALATSVWKPDTNGVIHACRNASTGALRLLSGSATACRSGEQKIWWEQRGSFRTGVGAPKASLGIDGDVYLDTASTLLYGPRKAGSWGAGRALGGAKGADGRSVLNGIGDPQIAQGLDGDFYVDTAAWKIFGPKTTGSWGPGTLLIGSAGPKGDTGSTGATGATGPAGATGATGPAGATGATGPAGAAGADGRTIYNGSGEPEAKLGIDGDFYIDTERWLIWGPKTREAWPPEPTSLVGPRGPQGLSGATGPAGSQGPKGDTGATGLTGAPGAQGPKGDTGATGLTGATGPAGSQGPKGDTGATGQSGATGAQGPKGDTGAPGVAGLLEYESSPFTAAAHSTGQGEMLCSGGRLALSGGFVVGGSGKVFESRPVWNLNPVGWHVSVENSDTVAVTFQVYVVCAFVTP